MSNEPFSEIRRCSFGKTAFTSTDSPMICVRKSDNLSGCISASKICLKNGSYAILTPRTPMQNSINCSRNSGFISRYIQYVSKSALISLSTSSLVLILPKTFSILFLLRYSIIFLDSFRYKFRNGLIGLLALNI